MADGREGHHYESLREAQRQAEEEERRRAAIDQKEKSPEQRLAAFEADLAEKLRRGRITQSERAYQLRRFDNALEVEINNEMAQRGRNEEAGVPNQSQRRSEEPSEQKRSNVEKEAAARMRDPAEQGEMTETRAARLARLREITEKLIPENENHGPNLNRDSGDRSR
jgi:hypothetical protein